MGKEILASGEIKIEKNKKVYKKSYIFKDVDIEKVLVAIKISSGKKIWKYFIGYLCDDYRLKLLHIMLPIISILNGCTFWMKMMTY